MFYPKILRAVTYGTLLLGLSAAFAAEPLASGVTAPNFKLLSQNGALVSLTDYKGKWVVLFFYDRDQSGDATLEARNFQRDLAKYETFNAVVIGVSVDTVESHKAWSAKDGLTFDLLSDTDHKIADAYGVPVTSGSSAHADPYLFIIAPAGKIELPVIKKGDLDETSAQMLACLKYFEERASGATR
jgi:peroxiredoxin Q/BCP